MIPSAPISTSGLSLNENLRVEEEWTQYSLKENNKLYSIDNTLAIYIYIYIQ